MGYFGDDISKHKQDPIFVLDAAAAIYYSLAVSADNSRPTQA